MKETRDGQLQLDAIVIKQSDLFDSLDDEEKEAVNLFVPKESYFVQSTRNYDMFKFMEANREVTHDKPIRESILNVGLLPVPIIVNEFFEIADGQGRYYACRDLNKPIYYMVVEGLRIEHVQVINSIFQKWTIEDYVQSYATTKKDPDYKYMSNLIENYNNAFTKTVIYCACGYRDGLVPSTIKSGELKLDYQRYADACNKLDWLMKFKDKMATLHGTKERLYRVLLFCYDCEAIDNEKLLEVFLKYASTIAPIVNMKQAASEIGRIYAKNRGVSEYMIPQLYEEYRRSVQKSNLSKGRS